MLGGDQRLGALWRAGLGGCWVELGAGALLSSGVSGCCVERGEMWDLTMRFCEGGLEVLSAA